MARQQSVSSRSRPLLVFRPCVRFPLHPDPTQHADAIMKRYQRTAGRYKTALAIHQLCANTRLFPVADALRPSPCYHAFQICAVRRDAQNNAAAWRNHSASSGTPKPRPPAAKKGQHNARWTDPSATCQSRFFSLGGREHKYSNSESTDDRCLLYVTFRPIATPITHPVPFEYTIVTAFAASEILRTRNVCNNRT